MSTKKNYSVAVSFVIIILAIYYSIHSLMPQNVSTLKAPKNEFSVERALTQLKEISKEPHFVGTKNHEEVREYIISQLEKLGLKVEIQTQIAVNTKWRAGANTKNILAKIKGSSNGKALLLLSHYDSSPHSSFGASDDGSGVVTILEGVRAFLANNQKPKNDIIILISDAEELGLLGANAFVHHHPWAKNVGLVLNFEARGSGGPSYILMETNGGNKNLVKAFNKAKPKYPVGNSLLYSIYKMLPNDTDLTIFREDGNIKGYNFAFLDDHFDYHTAQDTYQRLDKNTLQHQADYLMPLLYYFSNADLNNLSSKKDYVFFNFPGFDLINYPFSWVLPLLIISIIVFFVLFFYGLKSRKLNFKIILIGFIPFLMALLLSGITTFFSWKIILKIYPQYQDILHGFTYNGYYYITAFIALSIWLTLILYNTYFKKYIAINLLIAPIFFWLLINTFIAIFLPGAGFLIIPVIIALIFLGVELLSKSTSANKVVFFSILTIPILIIISPLIKMFPVGLGLKMMFISTSFTVLILGLMLPILSAYKHLKNIGKLFLLIGILSLISAGFTANYTKDKKQPNSILYILDTEKNQAYWASYNSHIDNFTKQYLGSSPTEGSLIGAPAASKYGTNFKWYTKTKPLNFVPPKIEIKKDTILGLFRKIHLIITPQRKVNRLEIINHGRLHFKTFSLNGEELRLKDPKKYIFSTDKNKHVLSYFFTKNDVSVDLKFTIPKDEIPNLELFEASYDLYTNNLIKKLIPNPKPRNEIMMPMPFVLNDAIVIKKKIIL